ncbi:MAG: class I SAM-dependent methyltransferase [Firmicutes bacterium]|nr:class I SAM-dependent methyltransferase [Bacillota bacterium]
MDIKYYKEKWNEDIKRKVQKERFWDERADEFNERIKREERLDPVKFLFQKGYIDKESKILDIGCGPGKYSLKFKEKCRKVIGIDISNKMISKAKENALKNSKEIEFKKVFWEDVNLDKLDWVNEFDLVFASMCPGINSFKTLNKMINASKGSCFLSGFVERKDLLWDSVRKMVNEDKKSRKDKIYYSFNILWQMGYFPEIKYINKNWEHNWSIDYIIELYISRIEMKRKLKDFEKENIANFLKSKSNNGFVKEKINAKIAWLYWNV